jgi:DDE superfamily endonuclease
VAVGTSVPYSEVSEEFDPAGVGDLASFRRDFYGCLTARADALFELTDAVLCSPGPVKTLVDLSLCPEYRRGHGALYDGLGCGAIEIKGLRFAIAAQHLPRGADGRISLAVDISPWLRPDAPSSAKRMFCHVHGHGKGRAQMVPGWPYSVVVALEPGRTSWTAVLDVVRLGPDDDETTVTAAQVREVVGRLKTFGHWRDGDLDILIVFDAGYDVTRLAFLLADLPVQLLGRLRSDRVLQFPAPAPGRTGRPARHGPEFRFADPSSWPEPEVATSTESGRYGTAKASAWDRLHPRLAHRGGWADHEGSPPIVEGTVIRLEVDHLPGDRQPKPLWLWWSETGPTPGDVDRLWQMFLRRFDIEHTFRLFKQILGWTAPKIRTPEAADRWTWMIVAAHTQLRLARHLAEDLRRPWERSAPPGRMTPARVRRGFPRIRATLPLPASAPKPSRPGPGRPPGSKNTHPTQHHTIGKHTKTDTAP